MARALSILLLLLLGLVISPAQRLDIASPDSAKVPAPCEMPPEGNPLCHAHDQANDCCTIGGMAHLPTGYDATFKPTLLKSATSLKQVAATSLAQAPPQRPPRSNV